MLRRIAVILNILVILTGVGFVLNGLHFVASLSLLAGGLNILMLRPPSPEQSPEQSSQQLSPRVSLLPIAFNMFVMTAGIQGTAIGIGYLYGRAQEGANLQIQHATGQTLMILCPVFAVAAIVSAVVFFRRVMDVQK